MNELDDNWRDKGCDSRILQLLARNVDAGRLGSGSAAEVSPSARVEHALHAVRPQAVRPPSFFTDVGTEIKMPDLARMRASHLPSECEFRVRVQVQMIGGETREILVPGNTECLELALDLNGRRMAQLALWVP